MTCGRYGAGRAAHFLALVSPWKKLLGKKCKIWVKIALNRVQFAQVMRKLSWIIRENRQKIVLKLHVNFLWLLRKVFHSFIQEIQYGNHNTTEFFV